MEHIPLVLDPAFDTLMWVLIFPGALLAGIGVIVLAASTTRTVRRTVAFSAVAALGFLMLSGSVLALTHSPSSPKNLVAEWREDVAGQLGEHYDIKLTAEDVEEMGYPESAPEGRVILGTLTLNTGREVALVFNDGRSYLRIIGEELPFD